MATTTFQGKIRSLGGATREDGVTPATLVHSLHCTVDPTAASAGIGKYLPADSYVINVIGAGGATGGTNPTIDVGTSADPVGFANELDADATFTDAVQATTGGALLGVRNTAVTEVYAGVGASAATGGTTTFFIQYVVGDSGAEMS